MKRIWAVAREIFYGFVEMLISPIPGGLGRRIRYSYYKRRLKRLGTNVLIDVGVRILNPQFVTIGDNTWIDNYVVIIAGPPSKRNSLIVRKSNPAFKYTEGEVVIGRNCHVALFAVLQGHGGLSIGDNCCIASGSFLYSMSHHYENPTDTRDRTVYKFSSMVPEEEQCLIVSPVVLEDNTGLGLNSVVLPGAVIREGSWVGTNSLVVEIIPPYSIAVGIPARIIKQRLK